MFSNRLIHCIERYGIRVGEADVQHLLPNMIHIANLRILHGLLPLSHAVGIETEEHTQAIELQIGGLFYELGGYGHGIVTAQACPPPL